MADSEDTPARTHTVWFMRAETRAGKVARLALELGVAALALFLAFWFGIIP